METCLPRLKVMQAKMKMASVLGLAVVLLCCSAVASKDPSTDCDLYGATGSSVTVPLKEKLKPGDKVTWKSGSQVIIKTKMEDMTLSKELTENGSYVLTNLKKSPPGDYIYEIHDKDGKLTSTMKKRLCVLDSVLKPHMTAKCVKSKVVFTCAPAQEHVNIMWLEDERATRHDERTLEKEAAEAKSKKYSCKVWNRASFNRSESLSHSCHVHSHVFPSIEDKLLGVSIWIFVGTGGGVVLVLMVVVVVCCVRSKKKRSMELEDEEELRLGWTNNEQPNHHHHLPPLPDNHPNRHHPHPQHRHHEQQQAGHCGPRQSRSKQHQRPRAPEPSEGQPQPQPRRGAQAPPPADNDEDHPPPLPQPRKKAPRGHVG